MKCSLCEKPSLKGNDLCRSHYTEANITRWLDNTDFNDDSKGIVAWAKENLTDYTPQSVPDIHRVLYRELLSLYNPVFTNKYERLFELIAFRGSGKSTAANFIFSMYIQAHNGRSFLFKNDEGEIESYQIDESLIVIVSETSSMAEDFVVRQRDEWSINKKLKYYYSFKIQDAIEEDTGQWTRRAYKFNSCFILGKGSGQQIRGQIKGASRPTCLLLDDIYSEESVKTEKSRANIKKWFYDSVFNTVDDLKGKVGLLGTIVHDDTVLVEVEKNDMWKTLKYPIMPLEKFEEFKKLFKTNEDFKTCKLPFDEIENKVARAKKQKKHFLEIQKQNDWQLAWSDRLDLYYLALKYKEAVQNGKVNGMYQEYFHITISPSERRFTKSLFQRANAEYQHKYGYNWLRLPDEDWQICNIEFGVDTGAGKVTSDNTVITITAVTHENKRFILNQVLGKFSLRDVVQNQKNKDASVCLDRAEITKIGVVDELYRQYLIFHPSKIKIGVAGSESLNSEEVMRVFRLMGVYDCIILDRKQSSVEGTKFERIINGLLGYYESKQVYHCFDADRLEYELEFLGKASNDDMADSAEVSFYYLPKPEYISMHSFEAPRKQRKPFHAEIDDDYSWDWRVN